QLKLYTLIWQRTLASQMADATGFTATVRLSAPAGDKGEGIFQASGTVVEFPGFLKASGWPRRSSGSSSSASGSSAAKTKDSMATAKSSKSEENAALPPMKTGEVLNATSVTADGHETQSPARYTEASLVKTLEAKEIGRPSTYASIISTIIDRGYVYERGRALIPSWLAFAVTKLLETNFPKYVDYQFTADMENGLDKIAQGMETSKEWLTRFYFGDGKGAVKSQDEAHEGLQQQVAQLGDIDARAINTIEIGDGLQVRVGRYGPYLEDTKNLDAEGNPKRASIPETMAPDELTVEAGHELIKNNAGGPRVLGKDPATGGTVEVRNGRFGPYVALISPEAEAEMKAEREAKAAAAKAAATADSADAKNAKPGKTTKTRAKKSAKSTAPKPKMASLFKTMSPDTVTLDDALKLLSLPREVGKYDETDAKTGETSEAVVTASNGRYGPYLTKKSADGKSETRSLGSEDEIFTVDSDKAKALFAQPKYGRGRGRGAAKPPLRDLGADPENGKNVTIKDGFYGAYITDGETNRTLPKQYTPESIDPATAFQLLAEKRAAGPTKRRGRRKTTTRKTTARKSTKSTTRKTTTRKSTAKKTATRKATAKK
ncbi:MAG: DNA topoisomerase I, partial [Bifidobacterium sp.]|nr:DNA topoisomerase I [Bifidobacterium sp.]